MPIETFELADLSKTRTMKLCNDSEVLPRSRLVALAWVADMLQDGWEIWNPDIPIYMRMRSASRNGDTEYATGLVFIDPNEDDEVCTHFSNVYRALQAMENYEYYGDKLEPMLEALEYGNTVPFRKWMKKI